MTPREHEVVALLASGRATSDKELATALGITVFGAKMRVWKIMARTDLHTRVDIAVWAIRREATAGRKAGVYRSLVLVPSGHRAECLCSVCYMHAKDRRRARRAAA